MDANSTQVTRPKRRAVRLSVPALMALVLLIGGGIGWVAYRARVQKDAVASIHKAGGNVLVDLSGAGRCPLLTKGGLARLRIARPDLTIDGEPEESD